MTKYKFDEDRILTELRQYIDSTYSAHYSGENDIQSMEVIFDDSDGLGFCRGNILKYVRRYGKKKGHNRDDLFKTLHYAMLLLYDHDKERSDENSHSG